VAHSSGSRHRQRGSHLDCLGYILEALLIYLASFSWNCSINEEKPNGSLRNDLVGLVSALWSEIFSVLSAAWMHNKARPLKRALFSYQPQMHSPVAARPASSLFVKDTKSGGCWVMIGTRVLVLRGAVHLKFHCSRESGKNLALIR
jgi:hypothetical protein